MSDREKVFPTLTRRGLLKGGAAVAGGVVGLGGFPYTNRFAVRAQETPLKFWQFYAPGGPVASQVAWFEKTVADWNDSHPQKIELEFIPNSEYISGPKLATAFASGEGPDIFIISPGDFLRYYNGGVLKDLTPFIDDKAKADFPESVIANRMVDGKIFGIPMEVEPMAMYYSVKAFEEAGLNENDVPKTWEALLEVAKKLTTPERFGVMFETQPGYYQNFTWYPFLWQAAANSRRPTARAASIRRQRCKRSNSGRMRSIVGWRPARSWVRAGTIPLPTSHPAMSPCRMSASGAFHSFRATPGISSMASSGCPRRRTANM